VQQQEQAQLLLEPQQVPQLGEESRQAQREELPRQGLPLQLAQALVLGLPPQELERLEQLLEQHLHR
jgi:hypothetical protein